MNLMGFAAIMVAAAISNSSEIRYKIQQLKDPFEKPPIVEEIPDTSNQYPTTEEEAAAGLNYAAPRGPAPHSPSENSAAVGYNDRKSWWFRRNSTHTPPSAQQEISISKYGGYYLGDTYDRVIYLTFDEGYENGYTATILDILKEYNVKAAFFVTKTYIEDEPELVLRMVEEGHIVGNHSTTHPDFTQLTDEELSEELAGCAAAFKALSGKDMPGYFRPPQGVYSIRTLEKTMEAGYKTIFWSFAYADWDRENQPGRKYAYDMMMNNHHFGAIVLLHAVSSSNTEALPEMLSSLMEEGYRFAALDELPD